MFGPKLKLGLIKGFQEDPYEFKFSFRVGARRSPLYKEKSPCPEHTRNLGQFALGNPEFKGVLSFIPREGGIEIILDKIRVDLFEVRSETDLLPLIEKLVEDAVNDLLINKEIKEAVLYFK